MKPEGKIRIVISIVIMMILAYFAIGFLYELYHYAIKNAMVDAEVKGIMIDGPDFTPVFRLFGAGINAFFAMVMAGIYAGVILFAGLILLIPFRLIGLNKKDALKSRDIK